MNDKNTHNFPVWMHTNQVHSIVYGSQVREFQEIGRHL